MSWPTIWSLGFKALCKVTTEFVGHVEPYSITESLPLIRELHIHGNQCSLNS
jgi:acetylornithine deacetylase